MSTTRSTKEIITPGQHKVVIYDYATGGEMRRIQAFYMDFLKAGDVMPDKDHLGKETKTMDAMRKLPASAVFKAQELALSMLIVSVDGCAQAEAYQAAMDLPPSDLDVVINAVDEYTSSGSSKKN